jgi:hypothetical protein
MPRGRPRLDDYSSARGDDVDRIIRRLLNSCFWSKELKHATKYSRLHDDHDGTYCGKLHLTFSEDGDAWIEISDAESCTETLRFRMPMMGGGRSPRTRTALLLLAEAIRLDNLHNPIKTPPVCTGCREFVRVGQEVVVVNGDTFHKNCARAAGCEVEPDKPETGSIRIPIKAGMTRRGAISTQKVDVTLPLGEGKPEDKCQRTPGCWLQAGHNGHCD